VEERAFALFWDYYNNGRCGGGPYLNTVLMCENVKSLIKDKDDQLLVEMAVQAAIQWLGTNVGSCFVNEVRAYAKKDKKRLLKMMDEKKYLQEEEHEKKVVEKVSLFQYESQQKSYEWKMDELKKKHEKELAELQEKHRKEKEEIEERNRKENQEASEWILAEIC
jgi:alpha-galactosidase/6-phospho-beta-glucosidase family protein